LLPNLQNPFVRAFCVGVVAEDAFAQFFTQFFISGKIVFGLAFFLRLFGEKCQAGAPTHWNGFTPTFFDQ
jgi:hypothetical protein